MGISGVGSVNSYIYNMQTGKLSTKDGSKDEFVDYFNGDLDGKDSTDLNGFDANRKKDIEAMIRMFELGLAKHQIEAGGSDEIEITSESIDAATSVYYINGEKVFAGNHAVTYTPDEIKIFGTPVARPFKTTHPTGYDPVTNRLSIGVGDVFDFGNGFRFTVEADRVRCDSYGADTIENYEKACSFQFALSALIHFGDQQAFSALYRGTMSTPMMLEFLNQLGVDTSREFTINETKCEVRNGVIGEVGNYVGVPSSIYQKALERYEQSLYTPLHES